MVKNIDVLVVLLDGVNIRVLAVKIAYVLECERLKRFFVCGRMNTLRSYSSS